MALDYYGAGGLGDFSGLQSGTNININLTDPLNPIINVINNPTFSQDVTIQADLITPLSNNLADLTTIEVTQLLNINSVTIINAQWGYLGAVTEDIQTHMSSVANPHSVSASDIGFGTITNTPSIDQSLMQSSTPTFSQLTLSTSLPTQASDAVRKDYVDTYIQGLEWQDSILDKDLTTPAGGESTGDRFIVASPATGDWATHEDDIAEKTASGWLFINPTEGMAVWVVDEDINYTWNGTAWVRFGSTITHEFLNALQGGGGGEFYHLGATVEGYVAGVTEDIQAHFDSSANPHTVTATHVGLGNVDNVANVNQTNLGTVTVGNIDAIANYYTLTTDFTSGEITQLQNINTVTIINAQWGYLGAVTEDIQTHMSSSANPHTVSASDVNLGNVDNVANVNQTNLGTVTVGNIDAIANYYALTTDFTSGEITQLQNIDTTTISAGQWGYLGAVTEDIQTHMSSSANPHTVSASDVNLGNVDNVANVNQTNLGTVTVGNIDAIANYYTLTTDFSSQEIAQLQNIGETTTIIAAQWGYLGAVTEDIQTHMSSSANPHTVTASDVNLGNVDNVANVNQTNLGTVTVGNIDAIANYYALTTDFTSGEITQLQNINTVTIINAQWGYLGAVTEDIQTHMSSSANPHSVDASDIGFGTITNTPSIDQSLLTSSNITFNNLDLTGDISIVRTAATAFLATITSTEDCNLILKADRDNDDETKHSWITLYQDGVARWLQVGLGKLGDDNNSFIASYGSTTEGFEIALGTSFPSAMTTLMTFRTNAISFGAVIINFAGGTTYKIDASGNAIFLTVNGMTDAEMGQIENINTVTIINAQWGYLGACTEDIQTHMSSSANPHSVDASDVSLGNVDNVANVNQTNLGTVTVGNIDAIANYYTLTNDFTSGEITQLQNINTVTIINAQWGYLGACTEDIQTHMSSTSNPHSVDASDIGFGTITNTPSIDQSLLTSSSPTFIKGDFENGDATYGLATALSLELGVNITKAGAIKLHGITSGGYALIQVTTNNLHIDAVGGAIYLGNYDNSIIYFNGSTYYVDSGGTGWFNSVVGDNISARSNLSHNIRLYPAANKIRVYAGDAGTDHYMEFYSPNNFPAPNVNPHFQTAANQLGSLGAASNNWYYIYRQYESTHTPTFLSGGLGRNQGNIHLETTRHFHILRSEIYRHKLTIRTQKKQITDLINRVEDLEAN